MFVDNFLRHAMPIVESLFRTDKVLLIKYVVYCGEFPRRCRPGRDSCFAEESATKHPVASTLLQSFQNVAKHYSSELRSYAEEEPRGLCL